MFNKNLKFTGLVTAGMVMGILAMAAPAGAAQSINAAVAPNAFTLDGKTDDWKGIKGVTVALKGNGGVSSVMIKAAVHGDMIYVLAEWADSLPQYTIVKNKIECPREQVDAACSALLDAYADATPTDGDGLRLDWPDRWVQVRASNTELIIRVIAEAPDTESANSLCTEALRIVEQAIAL